MTKRVVDTHVHARVKVRMVKYIFQVELTSIVVVQFVTFQSKNAAFSIMACIKMA